jgi:hypothetical protein
MRNSVCDKNTPVKNQITEDQGNQAIRQNLICADGVDNFIGDIAFVQNGQQPR